MGLLGILCRCGQIPLNRVMLDCRCTPKAYLWSILRNIQDRGVGISATSLTGCLAKPFIQAVEGYYSRLEDLHWGSFRGSLVHGSMENFKEHEQSLDYLIERRLYGNVPRDDGSLIEVSGQIDNFHISGKKLNDWKTTSLIYEAKLPKPDHVKQLWVYAWLLRENGYEVESAELFYIDAKRTYSAPVPLPSNSVILEWVAPRARLLDKGMRTGYSPTPEPSVLCNGRTRDKKVYCGVKEYCSAYADQYVNKKYDMNRVG